MRLAFNSDGVGVGASGKRRYNLVKVENQSRKRSDKSLEGDVKNAKKRN